MASSLVSSIYFPTRPVLGSNAAKLTFSILSSDERLARAEKTADNPKVEKDVAQALETLDEVIADASQELQAAAQLIRVNICFKRGNAEDAHTAADAAQTIFSSLRDKAGQAKAFHAKALAHFLTEDFSHAIKSAQKALALHKDKDLLDVEAQASELLVIAQWQLAASKPYASLQTAKQARATGRGLGKPQIEACALVLMCEALVRSGRRTQAVTTAKEGLAELKGTGHRGGIAAAHNVLLYSYIASDNPLDALDAAQDAMRYVQSLDDKRLEIDIRYMKCQAHLKNKEEEEAAKAARGAANLARELDDKGEEADALRMLSFALSNLHNLDQDTVVLGEAIEAAEEARGIYKTAGLVSGEASALMMLAVLNSQKDQEEEVNLVDMVKEAQQLYAEVDDAQGEHSALSLLVELHVQATQYPLALEFANSGVDLWVRHGSTKMQAEAMQSVANIYVMMEDFEDAENMIIDAEKLAREAGAKRLEASLSILLTKVYLEEGAHDKDQEQNLRLAAMTASEKALAVASQSGEKDLWAIAMIWRSQVLNWAGRAEEALAAAEKSEKAFEQLQDVMNQVRSMIKIAELFKAMGKKTEAKDMANKALNFTTVNPECESLQKDAQAVLDSMVERRPQMRSGGGGRMVRKLVKKWRKKGGGGSAIVAKGLDPVATQKKIKDLVMQVLTEDEDLGVDTPFMEAGVDSLGSVQLVTDVGKAFQMPLAPSIVFDYPTVRVLSDHLVEEAASSATSAGGAGGGSDEMEEYEDWEDVYEEGGGGDGDYMMIEAPQSQSSQVVPAAAAASAAVVVKKGLETGPTQAKLMELVKNVLTDDDEELHADMPFMEAGIDSLGSVQLVTDVGKAFQMALAPSIVFDYPSIRSLTEHLVDESKG